MQKFYIGVFTKNHKTNIYGYIVNILVSIIFVEE